MAHYDAEFFERNRALSLRSAEVVVPLVMERVGPITSVVDIGCGIGTWLAAFASGGVHTLLGVDGDYVDRETLLIDRSNFTPAELTESIRLDRRFDLAISLEVAEHLPESRAATFVADLCRLSDRVLFSAAIPGQPGTNHINLQWPSYWIRLFAEQGYGATDPIRPKIWHRDDIPYWYRQNIVLFIKGHAGEPVPDLVHPFLFEFVLAMSDTPGLRRLPGIVGRSLLRGITSRLR